MEKATDPSLFVNDGSFMERFKQLQQEKENKKNYASDKSKSGSSMSITLTPSGTTRESKGNGSRRESQVPSSGKLAFSLKQKSKLVAPTVKLGEDEEEDGSDAGNLSDDEPIKRPKLGYHTFEQSSKQVDIAPPSPSDPTVRNVADKLASFVAKNGRKFLFDESCSDYKYYEYRLTEEQKGLSQTMGSQPSQSGSSSIATPCSVSVSQRSHHQHVKYQTPASALYEATENTRATPASVETGGRYGESSVSSGKDPIAMMEYYMKKAAEEEKLRPPKQSKDEMPPPMSLHAPTKKGHHMGDYIPLEELEKFLASCDDVAAQKAAKEAAEKIKIQADNVGHKLLSKMGWKEGEGLGSSNSGIAAPIMAGEVKKDHLGVGAHKPGEVNPEDDIYEQYKKRMMLGYRHRPNPLNNPRKSYY
ncbi:SURP and G-patch domain-containing protein 1-like protein [Abeliophyllum distichum]|uniref:SURP and G-patch domain-containing protein 1-like protein n=1 Tax=Abeliophyllum distichum TaxID=126358 RepID=A0ABD1PBL1_9LAMI